jgi:hypothetical protein
MTRGTHRAARWLLLGALAAALACALGWALLVVDARGVEQREARARWAARPFGDYRLVAQDEHCTYDVLVRRGQVNAGLGDGCNFRARAIDALFALASRDREASAVCGPRGCLCEVVTHVRADYHPRLGYPTELRIAAEMRPLWRSPDVWRALLATGRAPSCGGATSRTVTVLAVEPLP